MDGVCMGRFLHVSAGAGCCMDGWPHVLACLRGVDMGGCSMSLLCRVLHGCFAPCPCMCAGCLHGWSLHVSVAQRVAWMVGPVSLPMSMVFAWGVSMSLPVQGVAWMLDGAGCLLRLAMLRDILETLWLDA